MGLFTNEFQEVGPLPNLPVIINYSRTQLYGCARVGEGTDNERFQQFAWAGVQSGSDVLRCGDSAALRDALDSITTAAEAANFLDHCGPFLPPRSDGILREISLQEILKWREYFRDRRTLAEKSEWDGYITGSYSKVARMLGVLPWPNVYPYPIVKDLELRVIKRSKRSSDRLPWKDYLAGEVQCRCAVEAIAALVEIERWNGVQYRICALDSCRELFRLGHRKERICCDAVCLHTLGQRRRRAQKNNSVADKAKSKIKRATSRGK